MPSAARSRHYVRLAKLDSGVSAHEIERIVSFEEDEPFDILGPHFCRVLKDHNPARVDVIGLIAEAICSDPKLKTAVKSVMDEHNKDTKMRWFDRILGVIGTILLALIIWGIQYLITHPFPTASPKTPATTPAP